MAKPAFVLTVAAAGLTVLALCGNYLLSPAENESLSTQPVTRTSNRSAYIAGCRTYPKNPPASVVYNTVRRNFVTWPCALEVPPPDGALEWERHSLVLK